MNTLFRRTLIASIAVLLGLCSIFVVRSLAQSGDTSTPWSNAVNISKSGAGSQPIIAAASDGTLHVIWWDTTEGEQYARTTAISNTAWTQPVTIPAIVGSRKVDAVTGKTNLTAPRAARLIATTNGSLHALWIDDKEQLLDIVSDGTSWGKDGAPLAASASAFDAAADITGALHLAYVVSANTPDTPAGIYYRVNSGAGWSAPSLVSSSQYFRSAQPNDIHLTVAGGGAGDAIVAWDDPQTGQSRYAWTADEGSTWKESQIVTDTVVGHASQVRAALAPNGTWLLIWRESGTGGCGFLQQQSSNGGQEWSKPVKILSDLTRCTESWTFAYGNDGRLWLIGRPTSSAEAATTNAVTIAAWDGAAWSPPMDARVTVYDPQTARATTMNCTGATVTGPAAGIVGCDTNNDIWAARSTLDLKHFITALKPVWAPLDFISSGSEVYDLPALAVDKQGSLYALWSQATGANNYDTALFGAIQTNERWSRSTLLIHPSANTNGSHIARQPAMAMDTQSKIHVVWSSGPENPVAYSWVFARDYSGATGWAEPIALPATVTASSFPKITIDSSGNHLYVIYAKPFNEQRGIYLARSIDGGSTWLTPTVVFDAAAAKWDSVDKPQIALDETANVLHAVWLRSTLPGSLNAGAIYYARSSDQGQTWSAPEKIAEGAVDWPQISLASPNEAHIAWVQTSPQAVANSHAPNMVWNAYSTDGGERWSSAASVPGLGEVSGPIGLSSDGAGHLYLAAVGESAGGESVLLISQWMGQSWGTEQTTALGQPAASDNAAVVSIAPVLGRLSVLLRLWTLGLDNQGQFAIAATAREVEPVAVTPLPTFTPVPTSTPGPTATPRSTLTPRPQLSGAEQQPVNSTQGPPPLVLGGVLAAIIVIIVSVRWGIKARRH